MANNQRLCKRVRSEDIACLPEELVREILLQLSLADVVNSRLVCSSWNSLICRPNFSETHFALSKKEEQIIFTTIKKPTHGSDAYEYNNLSIGLTDLKTCFGNLLRPIIRNNKLHDKPKTLLLQSSCRGLLLFQDQCNPNQLYLSNPLLAHYLALPPIAHGSHWGLVYDTVKQIYKVVGFYANSLALFTQARGWEIRKDVVQSDIICEVLSQYVCMGSELYWLSIDRNKYGKRSYCVFSMHISTEEFTKIPVPRCGPKLDDYKIDFSIRKGLHLLTEFKGYLFLTLVSFDLLYVLVLRDKSQSFWCLCHKIRLPLFLRTPSLTLSNFLYDDICIVAMKSIIHDDYKDLLDIFKIFIHRDNQLFYFNLMKGQSKKISYLKDDVKLCRSYVFHTDNLALWR